MTIKRGRPKKKTIEDVVHELSTEKEEVKQTVQPGESIAFKNKVFIYKDGSRCTVMYGKSKDKPIEIRMS